MIDVREDILARLLVIASGIPNISSAQRNNPDISEGQNPVAVVFDGDEETLLDATDATMRPPSKPAAVHMRPIIEISDMATTVGSNLNLWRRELIKGVIYDTELNTQIVKTGRYGNGAIRYLGCQTDIQWMRTLSGVLRVNFLFKYWFVPDDL